MKTLFLAMSIMAIASLTLSVHSDYRMLSNSEKDKTIQLNSKQWAIIGGGGVAVFILSYLLLGICCNAPIKTRESSSTLTAGLAENAEELQETERPLDDVEEVDEPSEDEVEEGELFLKNSFNFHSSGTT